MFLNFSYLFSAKYEKQRINIEVYIAHQKHDIIRIEIKYLLKPIDKWQF